MPRSPDELHQELLEQLAALRASARNFDNGNHWEAKRLATSLYIFLHDYKGNRSLLGQIGCKASMCNLSTASDIDGNNILADAPLTVMVMGRTAGGLMPGCAAPPGPWHKWITFDFWWNEPVLALSEIGKLSRYELIAALRNTDGGSHFDAKLKNDVYAGFARDKLGAWTMAGPEGTKQLDDHHFVTMRQIAYELDCSLVGAKLATPPTPKPTIPTI